MRVLIESLSRLDATTLDSVDWTKHCVIQQGIAPIAFDTKHVNLRKYFTIYMPIHTVVFLSYIVRRCKKNVKAFLRFIGNIHPNPPSKSHTLWYNRHRSSKLRYMIFHTYSQVNTQIYCGIEITKKLLHQENTVPFGEKNCDYILPSHRKVHPNPHPNLNPKFYGQLPIFNIISID